jgi:FlaA1/EpsC-like NDP-sugar epimerase
LTVVRNRYVLAADLACVVLAAYGAFVLRLDWLVVLDPSVMFLVVIALLVKVPVFFAFGLYRRYWRYVSLEDVRVLTWSVITAELAVAAVVTAGVIAGVVAWFPRSIIFIDGMMTLVLVTAVRAGLRVLADERDRSAGVRVASAKHVLIIGAGVSGATVAREMQRQPRAAGGFVGFLDNDPAKIGRRIHGYQVLGPLDSLSKVVKTYRIAEVIIAMPSASGTVVRGIVDQSRELGIDAKILPGILELIDGKVSVSRIRNIEIADLLRRKPVAMELSNPGYIEGECVLITGAGGSIGSELCRQIAQLKPRRVVLAGHGENSVFEIHEQLMERLPGLNITPLIVDVRDGRRLRALFDEVKPGVVFHAAAHKHVPLMELHPEEALTNNVVGTTNVIDCAAAAGAKRLVMISTDKAVAPSSIMGASKRLAEMVARQLAQRNTIDVVIVRFGNVLGSRGSVVTTFKRQIERGGPLTVTHRDMKRFFMTIPEAVHLVLEAGGRGTAGDLFVLDMGDPVNISQLADDLVRLSGYQAGEIPVHYTNLRPGEKLSERLWEHGATVERIPGVSLLRVVEPGAPRDSQVTEMLPELLRCAREGRREQLDRLLKDLIPSFMSNEEPNVSTPSTLAQ